MLSLLAPLIGGLFNLVDKAVEDKDQAAALKAKLQEMLLAGQLKEIEGAVQVIVAEAQGESWLQRNWRPMLMVLFGVIVANNYLLAPYGFGHRVDLPPDMWELLKIGVGGYVLGRSVEKGVRLWKQGE